METAFRIAAIVAGLIGIAIYFRSIIRMMLINRRERNFIEYCARTAAVTVVRTLAGRSRDYEQVQRIQAWVLPAFIFFAVTTWFLLVQTSFSFILWGLHAEASWPRAFSSSGSALSTLGYLTPPTLLGEYLATYEAAIGLAIVILVFTFVPGYQAAIQAREREVGWLYARTGQHPNCISLLEALKDSDRLNDPAVWEHWEGWFRGLLETHTITPILAYVPSVYRSTTWLGASAAVLDTTTVLLSCLDLTSTRAARICRETGVMTMRLIANELHRKTPNDVHERHPTPANLIAGFDHLYEKLNEMGLPMKTNKDQCRDMFFTLRAEYETSIRNISKATLMPIELPWFMAHAHAKPTTLRP